MLKFTLTGTYCAQNKGDAAMQISMATALQARGSVVTMLAPFADQDRSKYAPLEVVYCNRRKLIRSTVSLMLAGLKRVIGAKGDTRNLVSALDHTTASDVVIDLSGDMLTEDYGPHVAYSHYLPILRALVLGKPYFICAQSIGPFSLTKPLARFLLNRAAAVTVRDEISYAYLKDIGIRPDRLKQTADMAFLLTGERGDCKTSWASLGLSQDTETLGVSVSRLVADKFDKQARQKGAFVKLMADSINKIASDHQLQVLFTPHVTGPADIKDDRIISRDVQQALHPDIRSAIIEEDLRPQALKYFIAKCSMMVGTRMHANIGALSSHVPVVAISYSHKTPGIMRACGMEEYVVDFAELSLETLCERAGSAYVNRAVLIKKLKSSIAVQREKALENVEIAINIAEGKMR